MNPVIIFFVVLILVLVGYKLTRPATTLTTPPVDTPLAPCKYGDWSKCANGKTYQLLTSGDPSCLPVAVKDCVSSCQVSSWTAFSDCSQPCGGGTSVRTRVVIKEGADCPELSESKVCNQQTCPTKIDCVVGGWSAPTPCVNDKGCGTGTQTHTRVVKVYSKNGGSQCPPLSETIKCDLPECPIDCAVDAWTEWSSCISDANCGSGKRTRTRKVTTHNNSTGKVCPDLVETKDCKLADCPCLVSDWSDWGNCANDKLCGNGFRTRTRTVLKPYPTDSRSCPPLSDSSQECTMLDCCVMGAWGSWGSCESERKTGTASCGVGTKSRTRSPTNITPYNHETCPTNTNLTTCNTNVACDCNMGAESIAGLPKCCQLSNWGAWGACGNAVNCGTGGKSSRTRTITNTGWGGTCPPQTESKDCEMPVCNCTNPNHHGALECKNPIDLTASLTGCGMDMSSVKVLGCWASDSQMMYPDPYVLWTTADPQLGNYPKINPSGTSVGSKIEEHELTNELMAGAGGDDNYNQVMDYLTNPTGPNGIAEINKVYVPSDPMAPAYPFLETDPYQIYTGGKMSYYKCYQVAKSLYGIGAKFGRIGNKCMIVDPYKVLVNKDAFKRNGMAEVSTCAMTGHSTNSMTVFEILK